jgi:hypothetical protein
LVVAVPLFRISFRQLLLHLGGVFGGGVEELVRLLVPVGVAGGAVVLAMLWAFVLWLVPRCDGVVL